jgi:ATP-dependent Lon protease
MKNDKEIKDILEKKINCFHEIIKRTLKFLDKQKNMDIIKSSDFLKAYQQLELIEKKNQSAEITLDLVQTINNDLSHFLRIHGTEQLDDFIYVCFNSNYLNVQLNNMNKDVYSILKDFFHPIRYKVIIKNKNQANCEKGTITEDFALVNNAATFDIFANENDSNTFLENVYGVKMVMQDNFKNIALVVHGIIDDVPVSILNSEYINVKLESLEQYKVVLNEKNKKIFENYIKSLTVKELLIYDYNELYDRFNKVMAYINYLTTNNLKDVIKLFMDGTYSEKRDILIHLLINNTNPESEYLAYLLYDILNKDVENIVDNQDQIILYDSLPIYIKNLFRFAMKNTLNYTENLYNYSESVPLEQQICLMKVNDNVKEKAMMKLKELKSKSEDSGSKARQYLESLLKIPFGTYMKEHIMNVLEIGYKDYETLLSIIPKDLKINEKKTKNTNLLIINYLLKSLNNNKKTIKEYYLNEIKKKVKNSKKQELQNIIKNINYSTKNNSVDYEKIKLGKLNANELKQEIYKFMDFLIETKIDPYGGLDYFSPLTKSYKKFINTKNSLVEKVDEINNYIKSIDDILEASVHGHSEAKKQIKRIIGQWIVGENSGYCFGFEGPPGVGKTSLAQKGISKCLVDKNGKTRPFSFIAIGGSSNGSTLEGHNYTYVGSTWGKIVDILMDSKCMNPIIFIDELDKISNTEHGKEIIGILTHLIDPSQNMNFQDKYFNGIDLDLSKALFIFSYNDVSLIDRILLDRIHRVKFNRLTILDKLTITNDYLLPEIKKKLALQDTVFVNEENVRYIINNYTNESGVRKLKEILFEIFSEINLEILTNNVEFAELPFELTKEKIDKYLKSRYKRSIIKIIKEPQVGIVNGLWANTVGQGGILPMECRFIYSSTFLELKLTGMQGDVMKESMNVAKTLVWGMLSEKERKELKEKKKGEEMGIHIHCPDGATPKDGPSAGTAITILIYSLLTNKKVKNDFAITGEINLQGNVTEIGGLDLKIIGGIEAGVKHFIYPVSNHEDFEKLQEKYKESSILDGISFYKVERIEEVINLIIEN